MVESPPLKSVFLEVFRDHVDVALGDRPSGGLGTAGEWLGSVILDSFSDLNNSIILALVGLI